MENNKWGIVLEKGNAEKPLSAMTPEEVEVAARHIFKRVVERAAAVGQKPIVGTLPGTVQDISL